MMMDGNTDLRLFHAYHCWLSESVNALIYRRHRRAITTNACTALTRPQTYHIAICGENVG